MGKSNTGRPEKRIRVLQRDGGCTLQLAGVIDVGVAGELRRMALRALAAGTDVVLAWEKAERLDSSALQVLLALKADLSARGHSLKATGAAPEVGQYLETAGCADLFAGRLATCPLAPSL